ncbi:unnamed protein product [Prorocentrum cordatum]|uniref:ShKT domain-containing protein n=1 Tax=Prorocentrum cordatum TaxID=2364126 RepID=A0ABN9QLF7_9DINO|nr:unnamed protein product [Polarella glacialis]
MPPRPEAPPGSNGSGLPPLQPGPARDATSEAPAPGGAPRSDGETPERLPEEVSEVPGSDGPPEGGAPCEDTPGFLDERHEPCGAWASRQVECHRATEEIGFSQDGENAVVRSCRKSCGLCGSRPAGAPAPEVDGTAPQPTAPETTEPENTTLEAATPCDCDDEETVHVKITAVLTPKTQAPGGSLAQRAARGGGRRYGSGCDCSGGRGGSAPPVHVEIAGAENSPVSAVARALTAAVAAPDVETTPDDVP